MSTFTLNSITTKGLTIIAQLVAGSTLEFTRIAVGDGAMPSDKTPLTVTDLSHKLFDVDISKVEHNGNNSATVTGIFSNADKQEGFFYRELGLFAKDPKSQEEILYCYGNAGADAEWISPSGASSVIEKEVKITTLVGNAEHVTAAIKSGIYATQEEVEKELSTKADLDKTAEKGGRVLAEQMRFDQDQTIYVDAAATEEGADGSENKPFKTIQTAVDSRYKGAAVIYIKIKPGTYNENITVPRSPGTAWYFTREGSSTITLNTIIFEECSYLLFENMTLAGPANDDSTIISIKNVSKFDLNTITVNGNNNATGIKFSNSRGILRNSNINNCAVGVAATDASFIYMKSNSGTNNTNALKAVCSVIMSDYYIPSAETPFIKEDGGCISVQGGASTIPSNYSQAYGLGEFSDVNTLKNTILAEFGKLGVAEIRDCWLTCNITTGFGPYTNGQKISARIEKLTNVGKADGIVVFRSYENAAITFMQIRNGVFFTETPKEIVPEIASEEEAKLGENNSKMMTPLRTQQAMKNVSFIDLLPIGWVSYKEFLLPKHVKLNGATVKRSDYLGLKNYADENDLWTDDPETEPLKFGRGDGSTTMVLPDYRNRVIQGGDIPAVIEPGLPNVKGNVNYQSWGSGGNWSTSNSGALYASSQFTSPHSDSSGSDAGLYHSINIDASRSSALYGNSDTVQPPALQMIPQIKY